MIRMNFFLSLISTAVIYPDLVNKVHYLILLVASLGWLTGCFKSDFRLQMKHIKYEYFHQRIEILVCMQFYNISELFYT